MSLTNLLSRNDIIWIVAPHADDEVLGCGGIMNIARKAGAKQFVLITSLSGFVPISGGRDSTHHEREVELEIVMTEAGVQGYDILFWKGEHHLALDSIPLKDMISWLEAGSKFSLSKMKPNVILVPSAQHHHQDHRAVHEALLSVFRIIPVGGTANTVTLEYEIPGTGQTGFAPFEPNLYIELSEDELNEKCRLFSLYNSQVAEPPQHRSLEAIRTLASYRGFEAGVMNAEAFRILRFNCLKHD